jgi:hypothetical protein
LHIHNTFCLIGWKALGNWRFFALQRDKVAILLYTLPEKKTVFFRGGVKTFLILSRFGQKSMWA